MTWCIEMLQQLWSERCKIVNESLISKVRIEDHCTLLNQAKELYNQVSLNAANVLHQCKHRLNKVSTETLRGIAYELLSILGVDSQRTYFHTNLHKSPKDRRQELNPETLHQRDLVTVRQHKQSRNNKRLREEFDDAVESTVKEKRWKSG